MSRSAGTGFGFRADHKLLKTDEFSSVFAFRRSVRSGLFQLSYRPNPLGTARLGVVVAKKFAPLAVVRNRIKRCVREHFRLRRADLPQFDMVVRLAARIPDGKRRDLAEELSKLFSLLRA